MEGLLIYFFCTFYLVYGDYDCVCNYQIENEVYSRPNISSAVIGYLYEFDCKEVYNTTNEHDGFIPIQFDKQVGYIFHEEQVEMQVCAGTSNVNDRVLSTTNLSTSTTTDTTTLFSTERSPTSVAQTVYSSSSQNAANVSEVQTEQYILYSTELKESATMSLTTPKRPTNVSTTELLEIISSSMQSTFKFSSTLGATTLELPSSNISKLTTLEPSSSSLTSLLDSTKFPKTSKASSSESPSSLKTFPVTILNLLLNSTTTKATDSDLTLSFTSSYVTTPSFALISSTTPKSTTSESDVFTTMPTIDCHEGWLRFQNSCYYFSESHEKSRVKWAEAVWMCATISQSHLAIVETKQEKDFLRRTLEGHSTDSHDIWLAGTDQHSEGEWYWYNTETGDKSRLSLEHEMHMGDEKDDDCLAIDPDDGYRWEDEPCDEDKHYICELSISSIAERWHQTLSWQGCDSGWISYEDSCYIFLPPDSWNNANDHCKSEQSHLVILDSEAENRFLIDQITRMSFDVDPIKVWTAGRDREKEGHFVWINEISGDRLAIDRHSFQNWHHGEPDTGSDGDADDCISMEGDDHFEWHDSECDHSYFYVCEKQRDTLTTIVPTTSPALSITSATTVPIDTTVGIACPDGWILHFQSCYKLSSVKDSWDNANGNCYGVHSHLVIIESLEEGQYITNLLNLIVPEDDACVWTAGIDEVMEGVWVWSNYIDHTVPSLDQQTYTNWSPGAPNTGALGNGSDCLTLEREFNFAWKDTACSKQCFYMCENTATASEPGGLLIG